MFFDVRIPIGMMFTMIGTILTAFGVATRDNLIIYQKCFGIDINLWWGPVLLAGGIVFLVFGRMGQTKLDKRGK